MARQHDAPASETDDITLNRRNWIGLLGSGATVGLLGGLGGLGTVSASNHGATLGGGPGYSDTFTQDDAHHTATSLGELVDILQNGAESGEVVFLADDVTVDRFGEVVVPSGVTLASGRGADGAPSGSISATDDACDNAGGAGAHLDREGIVVMEDDARVTGLELAGPFSGSRCGNLLKANGTGEIDNCHIHGGGHANVFVIDDVHFHHNISEDVMTGGLGYGISIYGDGNPTIEYNYFNRCRHAVSAHGENYGYVCRYNHFGPTQMDQVVDVHSPGATETYVHNNVAEALRRTKDNNCADFFDGMTEPGEVLEIRDNWVWSGCLYDSDQLNVGSSKVRISGNHLGKDAGVTFSDIIPGYDGEPATGNDGGGGGGGGGPDPGEPEVTGDFTYGVEAHEDDVEYYLEGKDGVDFSAQGDYDDVWISDDGTRVAGLLDAGDEHTWEGNMVVGENFMMLDATIRGDGTAYVGDSESDLSLYPHDGATGDGWKDVYDLLGIDEGQLLEIRRAPGSSGTVKYIVETDGAVKSGSHRSKGHVGGVDAIYGSKASGEVSSGTDPYVLEGVSRIEVTSAGGDLTTKVDGEKMDLSVPTSL